MSMWRCPHCGTPQAESARCWVCHRSSTTCSTCRHFRRGVAAQLGYCGLDTRRLPLAGTEMRGCWEPALARAVSTPLVETAGDARSRSVAGSWEPAVRLRDFVPVELRRDHRIVVVVTDPAAIRDEPVPEPLAVAAVSPDGESGWLTLFGEPEG